MTKEAMCETCVRLVYRADDEPETCPVCMRDLRPMFPSKGSKTPPKPSERP